MTDTKALVERLRLYQTGGERKYIPLDCATVEEAADAIEALAARAEQMEVAAVGFAKILRDTLVRTEAAEAEDARLQSLVIDFADKHKAAEERAEALLAELRAKEAEIEKLSIEVNRLKAVAVDNYHLFYKLLTRTESAESNLKACLKKIEALIVESTK